MQGVRLLFPATACHSPANRPASMKDAVSESASPSLRAPVPAGQVVPRQVCTRCGACYAICPTRALRFDRDEYPVILQERCIECWLCRQVCPGIEFDLQGHHRRMFGEAYPLDRLGGAYRKAYVGYSTDPQVRVEGSSGGVVTQLLLSLLASGQIDAALVVGFSPEEPLTPLPYLARTAEQIRAAAQSKYVVVANARELRELRNVRERIAFVGLPCQVHGLRKLEQLHRRLQEKVVLAIGLACRGTFERRVVPELLEMRAIDPKSVVKLGFRDGPFPGRIRAWLKDGRVVPLHRHEIKDGAFNHLLRLYLAERCQLCPDYSAEFSDLSCSDLWVRSRDGRYLFPDGATLVMCRSGRGERIVEAAGEAGSLELHPFTPGEVENAYRRVHWEKKVFPFVQVEGRKRRATPAPDYGVAPAISRKDRLLGWLYRQTFLLGRNAGVRRAVLRLLFSPIGEGLISIKISVKKMISTLRKRMAT